MTSLRRTAASLLAAATLVVIGLFMANTATASPCVRCVPVTTCTTTTTIPETTSTTAPATTATTAPIPTSIVTIPTPTVVVPVTVPVPVFVGVPVPETTPAPAPEPDVIQNVTVEAPRRVVRVPAAVAVTATPTYTG